MMNTGRNDALQEELSYVLTPWGKKRRQMNKWKNWGGGTIIVNEKQRGLQQNVKRKNVEKIAKMIGFYLSLR